MWMWRAWERPLLRAGEEEVSVARREKEVSVVRRGGERCRRHWAWGEVVFTGRRGGDVDGGGSLGRVGKDCVTGLLLSSDVG